MDDRFRLRHFAPPILSAALRRLVPRQKLYPSYAAALADSGEGYEDPRLIQTVYERTRRYRDALASGQPAVFDLAAERTLVGVALPDVRGEMRVLDFGGACGAHYFMARAFLRRKVTAFRWHVVETPAMAAAGKALEDGQLRFFSDLAEAAAQLGEIDLIFSSGALQGVPDPYLILRKLTDLEASSLYLSWVGLTTLDNEMFTVQRAPLSAANGPGPFPPELSDGGVRFPTSICRKSAVEAILRERYVIDLEFHEDSWAYSPGNHRIDMYGYYAVRKPD